MVVHAQSSTLKVAEIVHTNTNEFHESIFKICTNLSLSNTSNGMPHAVKSADAHFERASGLVVHALRTMVMPDWIQG